MIYRIYRFRILPDSLIRNCSYALKSTTFKWKFIKSDQTTEISLTFYRPTPNHLHCYVPNVQTIAIYHASPLRPHSEHPISTGPSKHLQCSGNQHCFLTSPRCHYFFYELTFLKLSRQSLQHDESMMNGSRLRTDPWCTPLQHWKPHSLSHLTSPLLSHPHTLLLSLSHTVPPNTPSAPTKPPPDAPYQMLSPNQQKLFTGLSLCQIFFLQLTNYKNIICHAPTCHKFKLHVILN